MTYSVNQISKDLINSDACFSKCGLYRWWLYRRTGFNQRKLLFIGLNPSNANKYLNDPTTIRLVNFSRSWNYGTLLVINLFAKVASSPSRLKHSKNPIGYENDLEISKRLRCWAYNPSWDIWLGWGAKGILMHRNLQVLSLLNKFWKIRTNKYPKIPGPLAIGLTKCGQPKHPLYVPCNEALRPFDV